MPYSELAYFEGFHFAHIAEWEEEQARERKRLAARFHRQASRKRYTSDNPVHEMQEHIESRFAIRSCA